MIPRYRAWIKKEKCFADQVRAIRPQLYEIDLWWEGAWDYDCFNLDDVVLMQSTGLKDKNGKEIFEGDIVTDGEFARIVQYHQTLGFYMFDEEGNERFFSDSATLEDFEEDAKIVSEILEIIGNVYENPELLEVTE